jgi:hypothetical protein
VSWSSKVTTVRFREYDPRALRRYSWGGPVVAKAGVPENHADVSSAANEIYAQAAGTCVMDALAPGLSSVASEANVAFPSPFVLQVDNAAAQAPASSCQRRYHDAGRSRLRHIVGWILLRIFFVNFGFQVRALRDGLFPPAGTPLAQCPTSPDC